MASAVVSRECSKCNDAVGSFNCAGCKEIFCIRHSVEHRQELCTKFEQLMREQNIVLQELEDKETRDESLKKDLYHRIDEWKNAMIEKVCQRAKEINEQVDELIDVKDEMMINNMRSLTNDIHRRREKDDFFEHDIDRIKQNIKEAQQTIDKSIQPPDIELYIEPNEKIDWENLIYITKKSNSASSSVTKKQNTDKDKNGSRNIMNPNMNPYPYFSVPSYTSIRLPRPMIMGDTPTMYSGFVPIIRPTGEPNSTINLPNQTAKREKKPLLIIHPVDRRPIELQTSSILTDNNHQDSSL